MDVMNEEDWIETEKKERRKNIMAAIFTVIVWAMVIFFII